MLHIASIHSTRLTEKLLRLINMMRRRDSLNRTKITPSRVYRRVYLVTLNLTCIGGRFSALSEVNIDRSISD